LAISTLWNFGRVAIATLSSAVATRAITKALVAASTSPTPQKVLRAEVMVAECFVVWKKAIDEFTV